VEIKFTKTLRFKHRGRSWETDQMEQEEANPRWLAELREAAVSFPSLHVVFALVVSSMAFVTAIAEVAAFVAKEETEIVGGDLEATAAAGIGPCIRARVAR